MPDANREFYDWEEDEIKEWIKKTYKNVICPVCETSSHWESYTKIPLLEFKWVTPIFPVMCTKCGYLNFHCGANLTLKIKIPREGGTT